MLVRLLYSPAGRRPRIIIRNPSYQFRFGHEAALRVFFLSILRFCAFRAGAAPGHLAGNLVLAEGKVGALVNERWFIATIFYVDCINKFIFMLYSASDWLK